MAIKKIQRNGKTVWRVTASKRDKFGKRHQQQKFCSTYEKARRYERDMLKTLEERAAGRGSITWGDFLRQYEEYTRTYKAKSTYDRELHSIRAHVTPVWKNTALILILPNDVRRLLDDVFGTADDKLSTKRRLLTTISSVFRYAVECGYIPKNPAESIRIKVPEPDLSILSSENIRVFLNAAKRAGIEWYPVWLTAIQTGLRNGELFALRVKSVDMERGLITVRQTYDAKTNTYKDHTKNFNKRVVPISPELRDELTLLMANKDPEDFVLPRIRTWAKGDQSRELRLFLKALGLPVIRFHDLRACFITQMILQNKSLSIIQEIVGHADTKVLTKHYQRLTGADIQGKTDSLQFLDNEQEEPPLPDDENIEIPQRKVVELSAFRQKRNKSS